MLVNRQAIAAIYKSFSLIFAEAMKAAQPVYTKIATEVPSSTRENVYPWLGKVPRLREWIGDRQIHNLAAHSWTIVNKDWEATIEVDRNDIEDDTLGVYTPIIQQLGEAAELHPDELIFELLLNGFNTRCYDGQYFFDTDHRDGEGPIQSNMGTKALSVDSYAAARAQMMSITDEHGRPLGVIPNLLLVPPQLERTALEIVMAERDRYGATNIYQGSAEVLVVPQLAANPTSWFLLDTKKPIRPLIFQRRKAPEFVARDQLTDENVFMRKTFLYGVDSRDNAGYGLWQLAYGSTGEDN